MPALVAQGRERRTSNSKVAGSIPAKGTKHIYNSCKGLK